MKKDEERGFRLDDENITVLNNFDGVKQTGGVA